MSFFFIFKVKIIKEKIITTLELCSACEAPLPSDRQEMANEGRRYGLLKPSLFEHEEGGGGPTSREKSHLHFFK